MKKFLIALLLITSMVLALSACNFPALGGGETETQADNPEENVDNFVSSVNGGLDFNTMLEENKTLKVDEIINKIQQAIDKAEFEVNATVDMDGEKQNLYVGVKDRVAYYSVEGDEYGYIFVEDDLKLVSVSGYKDDDRLYSSIEDELCELMETLKKIENDDAESIEDADVTESLKVIESILAAKLPQMSAEDIEYKDGRYYISEEYLKNAVLTVVEQIYTDMYTTEMNGEIPREAIDELRAQIGEIFEKTELSVWIYMEREEIVGFGLSANMKGEAIGLDSDLYVMADITADKLEAVLKYEELDMHALVNVTTDEGGKLQTLDVSFDMTSPETRYTYGDDYSEFYELRSTTTVNLKASLNLASLKADGSLLSFDFSTVTDGYEAYKFDVGSGEYELDAEATAKYANDREQITAEAEIVSKDGGKSFDATFTANQKNTVDDYDDTVSVVATASVKAKNMPAVPADVLEAKEQELYEYENMPDYGYGNGEAWPEETEEWSDNSWQDEYWED